LSNAQDVNIEIQDGLSTRGGSASQFEGINAGGGSVALSIDNRLSFDLAVDPIQLRNADEPSFGNLKALGIDLSFANPPIEGGTVERDTVDMSGRGISDTVDVLGAASPASSEITVSADDTLGIATEGLINIQTLYFHPSGERLNSRGTFSFDEERVTFEEGDFVEVSSITLDVSDLTFDPQVDVDTFSLIYPDLKLRDRDGDGRTYEPGLDDAFRARFVENPSGKFEFDRRKLQQSSSGFQISFEDANVRIFAPGNNELEYEIRGLLEEGLDSDAIVSVDDKLSGNTTITNLTLEEIDVSEAEPFTVTVPTNDGDNKLDIAEDDEVREASFEGFGSITNRVDGLQLANANLDFFIETKNMTSTSAQLYAAIQGQNDASSIFLAGKGDDRGVSSLPFEKQFVEAGTPIEPDSLIRLGVDLNEAQLGELFQQQEPVTGDNSNVPAFINALPTQVRFLGQARLNADGGDLRVRKPLEVDAGFALEVPLQIKSEFVVRDTIDADFSSLEDATDPTSTLTASDITFEFGYENGLPLGANAELTIADSSGAPIKTFSGDKLRIEPAPKNAAGAAEGTTGPQTAELNLGGTLDEIRTLAAGREIRLRLAMTQAEGDQPAQLRADDTIRFSLKLNANASVNTN